MQDPHFFKYDDQSGLPSNQVYSIALDQRSFIWIGSDAGLYKFDGKRYTYYKSLEQSARAITGLSLSSSGKIYCYNFQSELFCLENNTLKKIPQKLEGINNLTTDQHYKIYVSHKNGVSIFDEIKNEWSHYGNSNLNENKGDFSEVTKLSDVNDKGEVFFLKSEEIGKFIHNSKKIFLIDSLKEVLPAKYILVYVKDRLLILSVENNEFYEFDENKIRTCSYKNLNHALKNKKLTKARFMKDDKLWVCTYNGLVCFDPITQTANTFYSDISFSDCLIDDEGNYWFSTLHDGLLFIKRFEWKVWNENNPLIKDEKITKVCVDSSNIYFATSTGQIGRLNPENDELNVFFTGFNADVQSLDIVNDTLWFNINDHLFILSNDEMLEVKKPRSGIKTIFKISGSSLIGTNSGLFLNDSLINEFWTRELKFDPENSELWAATNGGLFLYEISNEAKLTSNYCIVEKQIVSIDLSENGEVFAITFDGKLIRVDRNRRTSLIVRFPDEIKFNKLRVKNDHIYLASNKGVIQIHYEKKTVTFINRNSGSVSDNVQDLVFFKEDLFLATGKGLQKVTVDETSIPQSNPKIYLKNKIDISNVKLNNNEPLILYPEVSNYSSMGNFKFAYRNISDSEKWNIISSDLDRIEIRNLPTGKFEIELKATDHLGKDSKSIFIKGSVDPPYWKTIWFVIICFCLIFLTIRFVFKITLDRKQKKLRRENELNLQKLAAIKAQMNPHFIFNVLSSIKGYIYENDKILAVKYLDEFSGLMRQVLELSHAQFISLEDELNILKLYIELEGMMLENFEFKLAIDEKLKYENLQVPALLLQPFVENSFKHGLRHTKDQPKILEIKVTKSGQNKLEIEISDNGIGREKSEHNNTINTLKHKSFASEAILKRIELINSQLSHFITIETTDNIKDELSYPGTKVIVKINYLK